MAGWAGPEAEETADELERSADPRGSALLLQKVREANPGADGIIAGSARVRAALIAIAGASAWLSRLCVADADAIAVLADLDREVDASSLAGEAGQHIDRARALAVLRIAARDLLGLDGVEEVGANLSALASTVLEVACAAAPATAAARNLAVVGMGKLGGAELNYSSDIDILLVAADVDGEPGPRAATPDTRPILELARRAWRVDLDLRPEGRSGPLVRSLASYAAYWDRWAETWEFQALIKSRTVAGDAETGAAFQREAHERIWTRPFGADDLRQIRHLKERAEVAVDRRGLGGRELKSGRGGIRDIEFAVQLLQMVHGRADPSLRPTGTLPALRALAAGGYVGTSDAVSLEQAYLFLRTVEHRLQLRENEQVHAVPTARDRRNRLARVLGYRDRADVTAIGAFEADLRRHQATVRGIHERLFFRPLLEAFSAVGPGGQEGGDGALEASAVEERLRAFGFADARRTRQAVAELTRGFRRTSQLMQQMLPVLLDWLSEAPDADLGLLGLRTLAGAAHSGDRLAALCRDSPEAARQLCHLLGTGPRFANQFRRHPELLTSLARGELLVARDRRELLDRAERHVAWRSDEGAVQKGLRAFARAETLRIAARDVLGLAGVAETGSALTDLAEVVIELALRAAGPAVPLAVVGMGRLGGRELAYSSDLDLMFAYASPEGTDPAAAQASAEAAAVAVVRLLGGSTPARSLYRVDTALRPEGRQGMQARSLDAYEAYYSRWAQPWERQALLRGRIVAGDERTGDAFAAIATAFVWGRPFGNDEVREIRRTKARVERERIPASEDPEFHLKLGPGALADVEWTVQLLQLQHGVVAPGTIEALGRLVEAGAVSRSDADTLAGAYRFCERARNRLALVRDIPGDSLPSAGPHLTVLARSLGTSPTALREDYRRHTRRARAVVERLFYAAPTSAVQ